MILINFEKFKRDWLKKIQKNIFFRLADSVSINIIQEPVQHIHFLKIPFLCDSNFLYFF